MDLAKKSSRDINDQQIKHNDLFVLVMDFPCGPWNPWTVFNASKSDVIAQRVDFQRSEYLLMLKWVAGHARSRTAAGKLTLLENGWRSAALNLESFASLIDFPDGVIGDSSQWTRGDRCMLGQKDADSGEPIQASTAWGTNSARIRDAISIECDDSHSHQRIEGSNSKGLRSLQKAVLNKGA